MKKLFTLSLLLSLFFTGNELNGQAESNTIEIQKRKVFYKGKRVKKVKEIGQIIYAANDAEASRLMDQYKRLNTIGTVTSIVGDVLILGGLIQTIGGASDGESGSGSGLLLGGAGVLLTGIVINLLAWNNKGKPAIQKYNQVIGQGTSLQLTIPPNGIGAGLTLTF